MVNLPSFKLENYFTKWEFKALYLLCSSDVEGWSLKELLALADSESSKLWQELWLGYTETKGLPLLRHEISQLYNNVKADQILTCAGAEEGIYLAMQALLSPGDHVIVFKPCYQSLEALPTSLGCEVTQITLHAHNQWQVNLDELKEAFKPSTRLVILNFPHNPTGTSINQDTLMNIVNLARQYQAYIFSDEVYRLLETSTEYRLPALVDCCEKGISLSVTSKAFGLAGLRIG